MSESKKRALLIFIKNPIKGVVKTRLAKTVGADKALEIYKALLAHTRSVALAVETNRLLFYHQYIPEKDDWSNLDFNKQLQSSGDLGQRMLLAFQQAFAHHDKVIIIGSDCPTLTPKILQAGFTALDTHDFVVGPAEDGGYYLLGMNSLEPILFENMEWSTDQVLSTTLSRIRGLKKSVCLLPTLNDVDTEEDWVRSMIRIIN